MKSKVLKATKTFITFLTFKLLRNIAALLLMTFVFYCCNNEHIIIKNDLEKYKLKGKVKKIEKKYWDVKISFGEITKVKPILPEEPLNFYDFFRELHFNKNGNVTTQYYLDENDSPKGFSNSTYDKYNRLIKETNNDNNTIEITYNDIELTSKIHSKFLNTVYPWEGINLNYYDKNSNLIKDEYFQNDELVFRKIFEYDDFGALISEKTFGGALANSEGELSETIIYKYENNDGKISSIYRENTFGKDLDLYTYNEYGDIISITPKSDDIINASFFYEYKYDKMENWIERIQYYSYGNNKIPRILTIRKIEYY